MDDLSKLLRQMGAEEGGKENIKGHAERLWKFMDDLAERDPQEYQNFLKKQAEAAGVGVEGKPGTTGAAGTRAPAEDPEVIVVGEEEATTGRSKPEHIALLIFGEGKRGDDLGRPLRDLVQRAPGEVYALRREPRRERAVRGLPKIEGGYVVVEISTPRAILAAAREASSAASSGPGDLDVLVEGAAAWVRATRGLRLDRARRRTLLLKGQKDLNREAAQGTSASELPESVLSKIAGLAGGSQPPPGAAGRPAAKAPKKPLIQEILSEGEAAKLGGPCLTGHEISNKRGKVSVRGGLAPGLSIADLSVDLDEAKRALVFSSPGLDAVTVALPEGTGTGVAAKYSQSSHRVTVKIT